MVFFSLFCFISFAWSNTVFLFRNCFVPLLLFANTHELETYENYTPPHQKKKTVYFSSFLSFYTFLTTKRKKKSFCCCLMFYFVFCVFGLFFSFATKACVTLFDKRNKWLKHMKFMTFCLISRFLLGFSLQK